MEYSFFYSLLFLCFYALQTKDFSPWGVKRRTYLYSLPSKQPFTLLISKITVLQLHCCRFSFYFITLFCFSRCLCYVMLDNRITGDILRVTEKCLPWFALRDHIFMESQKLEIVKVIRAHPVWMLD